MNDERTVKTLRTIAWQRAKGELYAMLETFWPGTRQDGQFEKAKYIIDDFIKRVEDDGLQE